MTNKGQVGEETVYLFETLKGMVAWGGGEIGGDHIVIERMKGV